MSEHTLRPPKAEVVGSNPTGCASKIPENKGFLSGCRSENDSRTCRELARNDSEVAREKCGKDSGLAGELLTADDVRRELRVRMAREGVRAQRWAHRHGFSAQYVSAVLCGRKAPSERMCEVLGLVRVTAYVRREKVSLEEALRRAATQPMTADEIRAQRISWIRGMTGRPREEIAAFLDAHDGLLPSPLANNGDQR